MKSPDALVDFMRDGLAHGHRPEELRTAMRAAGWSVAECDAALRAWSDQGLRLPVPTPRASYSTAEAVTYALLFFALLAVTWNIVALAFWLIEIWLPDADAEFSPRYGAARSIRWSVAVLVVVLPVFLWLQHRAERALHADPGQGRSSLRRRFGALTLFLAALVLLGAAVAVVFAALSGDLTAQFLAKAGIVIAVALIVAAWFRSFLAEGSDAR